MDRPDLTCLFESFIKIGDPTTMAPDRFWASYIDLLRQSLNPSMTSLRRDGIVRWFSFLVHGREGGVPTEVDDKSLFIHIRVEAGPGVEEHALVQRLPISWLWTRRMSSDSAGRIAGVDASYLRGADIAHAWQILGESSEWVLRMLDAHDARQPIPLNHVGQFLHLIDNQLLITRRPS